MSDKFGYHVLCFDPDDSRDRRIHVGSQGGENHSEAVWINNAGVSVMAPDGSALATEATLAVIETNTDAGVGGYRLGFATTTPLSAGTSYNSGVIPFTSSSQVQTEVYSDSDGTLNFTFYDDGVGTNAIRSLSVPYSAADGYRQFNAPTFGESVNYNFVDSGSGNSTFYYSTKLTNTAISPQGLALDAFVAPSMMASVNRSVLTAANPAGTYGNVDRTVTGSLQVAIAEPLSAFGEVRTSNIAPIAQIDAVYGLMDNVETFVDTTPGTGSVSGTSGNFTCQTGAGVGGYGVIRTKRAVRYRPGQASIFRFTAIFDSANATALSLQAAGPFNSFSGFLVGYNGADFGIMHRYGGAHETRTITVTGAAGGAENLSLTLNTVLYTIPLTAGSVQHNAFEIAEWLNSNQAVWSAWSNNDTVILFGNNVGALSGTYTFSSATATGTIAQDMAGVSNTEDWILQAAFNIDVLDGTGPSGMTLDVSKGNVYEVDLQYLGYGAVVMKIENPSTGTFFPFHRYEFANSLTTPTLTNPTLKIGWVAASLGSTTNLTVKGASAMGGVEGVLHPMRRPFSQAFQRTGVAGTQVSILAIRVRSVFRGLTQLSEVLPKLSYISPAGNKPCIVKVLLNPTFDSATNEPDWQYIDETESIVEYDTTGTAFTDEGTVLVSLTVFGSTTAQITYTDLAEEGINPLHLDRGDVLCISASISGGAGNDVAATITWLED